MLSNWLGAGVVLVFVGWFCLLVCLLVTCFGFACWFVDELVGGSRGRLAGWLGCLFVCLGVGVGGWVCFTRSFS